MAEKAAAYTTEPWQRLEGKVVLVTGASSGIGLQFCIDLAKAGCKLVAAARRTDRLECLCHKLNAVSSTDSTVTAVSVKLDLTADGKSIEAAVQKAWDAFGRIDALVNNAGVRGTVKSPLDISEEEWNNTIRTNITGTFLVSKSIATRMRDAKLAGSIINVSSIDGLSNRGQLPGSIAYAASKSAVNTVTKVMALELGPFKIRVNAIAPGIFKSEITKGLVVKKWFPTFEKKVIPLRDHGTTNPALTSLVRYLIHDSSEYVTGNVYVVDAGATLPGVPVFSSL